MKVTAIGDRNAAHCPGGPLHPHRHSKIFSNRFAESIFGTHPCARSLCRPCGPDGEGQARGQAPSARGEPPQVKGLAPPEELVAGRAENPQPRVRTRACHKDGGRLHGSRYLPRQASTAGSLSRFAGASGSCVSPTRQDLFCVHEDGPGFREIPGTSRAGGEREGGIALSTGTWTRVERGRRHVDELKGGGRMLRTRAAESWRSAHAHRRPLSALLR